MQLYPGVFINLPTAVILHLVLLRRDVLLRRQQQLDQRELALIQQQIHIERQRREEDECFLSMLLHEIRSPLSVVALSRAALERKLPQVDHATRDAALRDLQRIEVSVQQMREVLQQVQATSELEHRMSADEGFSTKAALETCEMSILLDRLVAEHIRHVRVDTLRLSTLAQGDRWLVAGGLERVLMMVRNLVNNAIKYSAPGSVVVLDVAVRTMASTGRSQCALSVVNQVGAVGAPDLQRLFKKYYRAPSAHQYSGSGLGLYWVRGIAQMLGGDVSCSMQDKEVTFTLELPIVAVKPVRR
jgi:signal transduction histidine kinase